MECKECGKNIDSNFLFCPHCGAKNEIAIQGKYNNIYGVWKVTTEGDCEGRSTKNLGTHEGYIDEIAFSLVNLSFYSLKFTKIGEGNKNIKQKKEVHIQLDIESGTWDMESRQKLEKLKKLFIDRPVAVEESNYFACIKLVKR